MQYTSDVTARIHDDVNRNGKKKEQIAYTDSFSKTR